VFYEITAERGCLRATLFGRETVEETREFFRIVAAEIAGHRRAAALLLDVRLSRPIFHLEPGGFFDEFRKLAGEPSCKIALLGDTPELRLSHEYLALLARQRGMNVWSFRSDAAAFKWLADRRHGHERRKPPERRDRAADRAAAVQRRRGERRYPSAGPPAA
jgi:hypothetical protein